MLRTSEISYWELRQTGPIQPRGVGPVCGQRDGFGADADERVVKESYLAGLRLTA